MRTTVRARVRERFAAQCAYCTIREDEAGPRLTIDHYHPTSQGGSDDLENLVYCCHACNDFKSDYWSANADQRLLPPLNDDLSAHFVEQVDHQLVGLTDRGRLHITILHLNRPELIAVRRRRHLAALREADLQELHARMERIETLVQEVAERIVTLTGGITVAKNNP